MLSRTEDCRSYASVMRRWSLSLGISEEIEDAKITTEKTKISRLKRRSENWPKFAWSNWTLRYKTVKTGKHYRKYLLLLNFDIWPHFTAIWQRCQQRFTVAAAKQHPKIEDLHKKNEYLQRSREENETVGTHRGALSIFLKPCVKTRFI